MHTSTHNLLKGTVAKVKKGEATAVVLLDLGGAIVAASLTNIAADDLKLAPGLTAYVIIQASDVIIGVG
jgi:molybdopterin-binding protein